MATIIVTIVKHTNDGIKTTASQRMRGGEPAYMSLTVATFSKTSESHTGKVRYVLLDINANTYIQFILMRPKTDLRRICVTKEETCCNWVT